MRKTGIHFFASRAGTPMSRLARMELRERPVRCPDNSKTRCFMNQIIYLIGLIVVIMAVLSLLGLR
mgnify:CR=1 FL=1